MTLPSLSIEIGVLQQLKLLQGLGTVRIESLEAKAKGRYCEKRSYIGLSIQDDSYLPKNDARFVNDMAT